MGLVFAYWEELAPPSLGSSGLCENAQGICLPSLVDSGLELLRTTFRFEDKYTKPMAL